MALPKLNDKPKYEMKIPSTQESVRFRPFLVKEEKVLMIAMESEETKEILHAVVDTLDACIDGGISKAKLTVFDVDYMFTKLRAKSVGESAKVSVKCDHCKKGNEVSINLDDLTIEVPDANSAVIELTENLTLEMKWPTYLDIADLSSQDTSDPTIGYEILNKSLSALITENERIDMKDESEEEIVSFIESMNKQQFEKINQYLEKMPKLSHDVEFTCEHCEETNNKTLEGMASFF